MAGKLTADNVLSARVRARWLDGPRNVAASMLEAADHPELLDGVTPMAARVQAGVLLFEAGEREAGIGILREVVERSEPRSDEGARLALAVALAQVGDLPGAEAVVTEGVGAEPAGGLIAVTYRLSVALGLAESGRGELARRWADAGADAANAARRGMEKKVATQVATTMRERVYQEARLADEAGVAGTTWPLAWADPPREFDVPAWPQPAGGRLAWWPQAEYRRLVAELPGVAEVIGPTWPEHLARVEGALRGSARRSPEAGVTATPELFAADFGDFVRFVEQAHADPCDAAAMTAYALAASATELVSWPPGPRKRCWCGSGRKYQECCWPRA